MSPQQEPPALNASATVPLTSKPSSHFATYVLSASRNCLTLAARSSQLVQAVLAPRRGLIAQLSVLGVAFGLIGTLANCEAWCSDGIPLERQQSGEFLEGQSTATYRFRTASPDYFSVQVTHPLDLRWIGSEAVELTHRRTPSDIFLQVDCTPQCTQDYCPNYCKDFRIEVTRSNDTARERFMLSIAASKLSVCEKPSSEEPPKLLEIEITEVH